MENSVNPIKLSGIRALIASKMQASLKNTAQLTYHCRADVSSLLEARKAWRDAGEDKVGYEDLLMHQLVGVLREMPEFNSRIDGKLAQPGDQIDISVAVSSKQGLVAPTVFNVQDKTVPEIAADRKDLIERSQIDKLTVPEMTGGTFTISNLGITVVEHFTPILNYPQIAILGLGAIQRIPWSVDGEKIEIRPIMGLSLTVDHQFIDGAESGQCLGLIKQAFEAGYPIPA